MTVIPSLSSTNKKQQTLEMLYNKQPQVTAATRNGLHVSVESEFM
jgi:hypothetical protein